MLAITSGWYPRKIEDGGAKRSEIITEDDKGGKRPTVRVTGQAGEGNQFVQVNILLDAGKENVQKRRRRIGRKNQEGPRHQKLIYFDIEAFILIFEVIMIFRGK